MMELHVLPPLYLGERRRSQDAGMVLHLIHLYYCCNTYKVPVCVDSLTYIGSHFEQYNSNSTAQAECAVNHLHS